MHAQRTRRRARPPRRSSRRGTRRTIAVMKSPSRRRRAAAPGAARARSDAQPRRRRQQSCRFGVGQRFGSRRRGAGALPTSGICRGPFIVEPVPLAAGRNDHYADQSASSAAWLPISSRSGAFRRRCCDARLDSLCVLSRSSTSAARSCRSTSARTTSCRRRLPRLNPPLSFARICIPVVRDGAAGDRSSRRRASSRRVIHATICAAGHQPRATQVFARDARDARFRATRSVLTPRWPRLRDIVPMTGAPSSRSRSSTRRHPRSMRGAVQRHITRRTAAIRRHHRPIPTARSAARSRPDRGGRAVPMGSSPTRST